MKLDDEMYLVNKTSKFCALSNFSSRLIRGFFGMLLNVSNVWFPYKCAMDSRLIFLLHMLKGNNNIFH